MKLRKIGAVLIGAALLGATLSTVATDAYPPPKEFFINPDGTPGCIIAVGSSAAAMDVVSASMLAAKIGALAVRVEEVKLPPKRYTSMHQNIPLYDWNADGSLQDERLGYPVLDVPDSIPYNAWDNNVVDINYTLTSLWWFDDYDNRVWGDQDGFFDPWETHEEIQYRFDNLAVFDPFTGTTVRDNLADLLGGDIVLFQGPVGNGLRFEYMNIPSLIYRADNIFVPPEIIVTQTRNWPTYMHNNIVVDLDYEYTATWYLPDPYYTVYDMLPKFMLFGTIYTVVEGGYVRDINLRTGEFGDLSGTPYLVTGLPTYYYEEYLYKDEPEVFGEYTVLLKDVDVDHNKAWFEITEPEGDLESFWMVLDPEHGFSPNLQQQGRSGEIYVIPIDINGDGIPDDYYYNKWIVGRAENDVWVSYQREDYEDDTGDSWWLFDVPMFVIDGVKVFVGANGTTGIEVKIYTLEDKVVFYDHPCCVPFVTEPNNYQLFLDAYDSGWDLIDENNYYVYQPPGTGLWPPFGLVQWIILVGPGMFIGNGFLDNNDGHIGYEYNALLPFPAVFFPEQNDLDRDSFGAPLFSNDCRNPDWSFVGDCQDLYDIEDPVVFLGEGQTMVELNIALCDIVEMAECLTRFVFSGPQDYFRIEMTDITWDDDQDGNPTDGIDWQTIMEVSAGTYTQVVQVDIDVTELVKLDIEIDSLDKQNFNLILIGGPVANQLSKELEDLSIPPDDGSPVNWAYDSLEGDFKLYTDPYGTGKDVLMVAGADRDATRAAAERLISKL